MTFGEALMLVIVGCVTLLFATYRLADALGQPRMRIRKMDGGVVLEVAANTIEEIDQLLSKAAAHLHSPE